MNGTPSAPNQATERRLHDFFLPGWPLELAALAYAAIMAALTGFRLEHGILIALVVAARVGPRITREAFRMGLPTVLILIGIDGIRFLRPLFMTPGRVLGCNLRAADIALFGVGPDTSLADYFTTHHAPVFDVFFAIPYGSFILVAVVYGFVLFFRDFERLRLLVWSFIGLYLCALAMWMIWPAAPPWYIQAHGCDIDFNVQPNAAALLRVDEELGINYFHGFYSHSSVVFGAMPSLHNAFAMLLLLVAWPAARWPLRSAGVGFVLWMIAGSVYLDHHWVLDALAGWLVAALSVGAATMLLRPTRAPGHTVAAT